MCGVATECGVQRFREDFAKGVGSKTRPTLRNDFTKHEAGMADYPLMNQLLYTGKTADVKRMTEEALAEGIPVQEVLENGLIAGMAVVGEDFKNNVIYVPEVMIA